MIDGNSVRDEVKDVIRGDLASYHKIDIAEVDADLVCRLADSVFDALGIDEQDQDQTRDKGCFIWLQGVTTKRGENE
jgi:hypothetical protein